MAVAPPVPEEPLTHRPERWLTLPLLAFLLVVVVILSRAAYHRFRVPSIAESVRLLADGDLDGPERGRILTATIEQAVASSDARERWAGLLAAIAVGDRAAYLRLRALVTGEQGTLTAPPVLDRTDLHLGDPMVGNLAAALWAEADGGRDEARRRWRQVALQSRLAPSPLAAELAAAAEIRLR